MARKVPAAKSGLFPTDDGVDIYFEDSGGEGKTLFYLYGLGCSIKHWKYTLSHFNGKYRQVWIDFRGHGASDPLPATRRLTYDHIVADILKLCEARGITEATFLGQSLGGTIALYLADRAPQGLVEKMVLLASPGRDPGANLPGQPFSYALWRSLIGMNQRYPELLRKAGRALPMLGRIKPIKVPFREFIRHQGFNPELSRTEDIEEYVNHLFTIDPNLFLDMARDLKDFDVANLKNSITCPVLMISGAHDQVVPVKEAQRTAKLLPNARLEVIPYGSHCPHFDDPPLVNRLIEGFLDVSSRDYTKKK